MEITLTETEKQDLERRHRKERDGRVRDRIKAVLLRSEGWEIDSIAQALRIHPETIRTHLSDWTLHQKVHTASGGSTSKLNGIQSHALEAHLQAKTYLHVKAICAYVSQEWGVHYTVSGMHKWLKQHAFSYKQPKATPAKADAQQQRAFMQTYSELVKTTPSNEPILFMDSAHPTMATKVVCGWIKKGTDKPIAQTASRTRVNVTGAIDLSAMQVTSCCPEYVNAETTVAFFDQLRATYAQAPTLHIILDQSGYHKSKAVKDAAAQRRIQLHYLPPYSPNLNPIERLWKVMNEHVRNNVFFSSATEFRQRITHFMQHQLHELLPSLRGRIHDRFQSIQTVI